MKIFGRIKNALSKAREYADSISCGARELVKQYIPEVCSGPEPALNGGYGNIRASGLEEKIKNHKEYYNLKKPEEGIHSTESTSPINPVKKEIEPNIQPETRTHSDSKILEYKKCQTGKSTVSAKGIAEIARDPLSDITSAAKFFREDVGRIFRGESGYSHEELYRKIGRISNGLTDIYKNTLCNMAADRKNGALDKSSESRYKQILMDLSTLIGLGGVVKRAAEEKVKSFGRDNGLFKEGEGLGNLIVYSINKGLAEKNLDEVRTIPPEWHKELADPYMKSKLSDPNLFDTIEKKPIFLESLARIFDGQSFRNADSEIRKYIRKEGYYS